MFGPRGDEGVRGAGHVVDIRDQLFTYTMLVIKTKISFEAKKKLICQFIFQ
jgi:hypothetical protein